MCKMNLEEYQNVDYIYCLRYGDSEAVQDNCQALEVTETTVECNLEIRQRSSQEILDLADYLQMHYDPYDPIRKNSSKSFSTKILPLWIELADPNSIFGYLQDKSSDWNDVMLMWDYNNKPSNLVELEELCIDKKWRYTEDVNVRGSEASVTILYNSQSGLGACGAGPTCEACRRLARFARNGSLRSRWLASLAENVLTFL